MFWGKYFNHSSPSLLTQNYYLYLYSSTHSHIYLVCTFLGSVVCTQNISRHDSECWSTIQFILSFSWFCGLFLHIYCSDQRKSNHPTALWKRESRLWPVYTYLWHLFKGRLIFKSQISILSSKRRKKKTIGNVFCDAPDYMWSFPPLRMANVTKSNYQGHCFIIEFSCKRLRS